MLSAAERSRLAMAARQSPSGRFAVRARIVLLAEQGVTSSEIARELGVSRPTVIEWRQRFAAAGSPGLADRCRSGRPPTMNQTHVVAATCTRPPPRLPHLRWSARTLSAALGVSVSGVARVWKHWGLRPHQTDKLAVPVQPGLTPWCHEVSGLYLKPPECALAVTLDPRRADPPTFDVLSRPTASGSPSRTYEVEKLVSDLRFVASRVVDICPAPQSHELFLDFLADLERRYPARALHVIVRDDTSLEHPETRLWLSRNQAVRIHRVPQSPSWTEIVELLFYTAMIGAGVPDALSAAARLSHDIQAAVDEWREQAGHFSWVDPIVSPFVASRPRR
jgi:transposase